MRSSRFLLIPALLSALTGCTTQSVAQTGFKLPLHYNLELADGIDSPATYNRSDRTLSLAPGRHQIVVSFKDIFGSNGTLVQAGDPIVVEIHDLKPNQVITFKYETLRDAEDARDFTRHQKVTLTDLEGRELPAEAVSYYVMTSENPLTITRDFRQELLSLDRLYAPTYVTGANRGLGMTAYGAPTIEATNEPRGRDAGNYGIQGAGMAAPALTYAQESNLATAARGGGTVKTASPVSLQQLIELYNQADDKTKLEFVKYVMGH